MHPQAYSWIAETVNAIGLRDAPAVLDLGGRVAWEPAGTIHGLFSTKPRVVDIRPGTGVDIVADAATWEPDDEYDVVLCTEVFEHTPDWRAILETAHKALIPLGILVATMASRDRPPHSAIDGGPLRPDEYYQNVNPGPLALTLENGGWSQFALFAADGHFGNDDLYCWAQK